MDPAGRSNTRRLWLGLDARERLKVDLRELTVVYLTGEKAPCPCIADGIMIATQASPGQGTLQVALEKAPAGLLAVAVLRNRKTGEGVRYTIRTNGCRRSWVGTGRTSLQVVTTLR
jgi:formylmethanofuran dehydrogenase subunit E